MKEEKKLLYLARHLIGFAHQVFVLEGRHHHVQIGLWIRVRRLRLGRAGAPQLPAAGATGGEEHMWGVSWWCGGGGWW